MVPFRLSLVSFQPCFYTKKSDMKYYYIIQQQQNPQILKAIFSATFQGIHIAFNSTNYAYNDMINCATIKPFMALSSLHVSPVSGSSHFSGPYVFIHVYVS